MLSIIVVAFYIVIGAFAGCTCRVLNGRILDFASGVHLVFGGDGWLRYCAWRGAITGPSPGLMVCIAGWLLLLLPAIEVVNVIIGSVTPVWSGPEPAVSLVLNLMPGGGCSTAPHWPLSRYAQHERTTTFSYRHQLDIHCVWSHRAPYELAAEIWRGGEHCGVQMQHPFRYC